MRKETYTKLLLQNVPKNWKVVAVLFALKVP